MKSPVLLYIFAIFTFLPALCASQSAFAFDVQTVRFGSYPDKTRLVLELSARKDFRVFVLPDPYRMVIDLPAFAWKAGVSRDYREFGIKAVRHGNLKPRISRIVFDLNRPITIHKAFTLPGEAQKPNRLVVDFSNTDARGFQSAQNNVLGALDVNAVVQTASFVKPTPKPVPRRDTKPLIIIDPGHGGVDPGAIGANGVAEKKVVLALAQELKKQLENSGRYRVKMTRERDVFVKLGDRVRYARDQDGDLFISIHADSIKHHHIKGASVYTLSEKASDAQAAKLAARENKADLIAGIELEVEDDAVVDILIDLARRNTQNQSRYFANKVVHDFKASGVTTLKSANRHANFAVLKAPDIPSVLVETGFMSNKAEADRLNTPGHRRKIAKALKKGIDAYFKTVKENERN